MAQPNIEIMDFLNMLDYNTTKLWLPLFLGV